MTKSTITWKNTLYNHGCKVSIDSLFDIAKDLGYAYVCWNGIIYASDDNQLSKGLATIADDVITVIQ